MTRLRAFWESIRATYWAVPSLMTVLAIGLSIGMIRVDEAMTGAIVDTLTWVYSGGAEGARAVLATIAGSMITVAGVTFSITIVALTLASQQFGPRLLRNFLRDLSNQIVLGTFVSTFVYCLLVLRTVRGTDDAQFVPHLAVTVGVLLAIVSLGVLIFFIHHISTSIQASHVISNVAVDLERAVDHLFPEAVGSATGRVTDGGNKSSLPADFADLAREVSANANGYIQAIDSEQLMGLATEHDLVLRVEARPGTFVRTGRVLLAARSDTPLNPSLEGRLRDAFIVGDERTPTQDIEFSINQLVELAVRALSPGINDPATACVCLDRLEQVLCRLAGRTMPSSNRYDTAGVLRVVVCPVTFPAIANVAFDEIERHGRTSVSVTLRLIDAIGAIASCVQREQDRLALLRHVTSIGSHLHDTFTDEADRAKLEQRYRTAVSALQRPNRALWPAKVDERDIA